MDAGSVKSRPLYLPWPCITTRRCASGLPPRSPPESQMASPAVAVVIAITGAPPRPPPKRMARLLPPIPRARVPLLPLNHHHAAADRRPPTTSSPTRRTWLRRKRRQTTRAQPRKAPGTRHARTVAAASQTPCGCLLANASFQ